MSDPTDDDYARAARIRATGNALPSNLATAIIDAALRDRRAQDTPSEPAAWAQRQPDGRLGAATTDPGLAESWRKGPWVDDHSRRRARTTTVVELFCHPAPVAAAPTGRAARIEALHRAVEALHDEAMQEPGTWALDRALARLVWVLFQQHDLAAPQVDEESAFAYLRAALTPPAPTGDLRDRVEQAGAGTVHVASEAAATVDAVMGVLVAPTGEDDAAVADEQPADDASVEWGIQSWGPHVSEAVTTLADRDDADRVLDARQRMWPTETHHLVHRRVSPWQRVGGDLPVLVAPPAPQPERPSLVCLDEAEAAEDPSALSPDCRGGKCAACVGEAWDERTDEPTGCACVCHAAVGPAT